MAKSDILSARDKAVLKTIFDPDCTIATVDEGISEILPENEKEAPPKSENERLARELEVKAIKMAEGGNLEGALGMLCRAVELAPLRPRAYNNRAQLLRLMNRDEDALADIERALQLTQDGGCAGAVDRAARAAALCQRGALLRRQEDDDGARKDFTEAAKLGSAFAKKQVVELNPYAALCNKMLAQVMRGEQPTL